MSKCVLNGNVIRTEKIYEVYDYAHGTKLSYIYETNEVIIEPYHNKELNGEMIMRPLRCVDIKIRKELNNK